jgi:hypothetical protein
MLPVGFQPTIPPNERLQTHTFENVATEISFATYAKYIMDKK